MAMQPRGMTTGKKDFTDNDIKSLLSDMNSIKNNLDILKKNVEEGRIKYDKSNQNLSGFIILALVKGEKSPEKLDPSQIKQKLDELEDEGIIGYAEPCLSDIHREQI